MPSTREDDVVGEEASQRLESAEPVQGEAERVRSGVRTLDAEAAGLDERTRRLERVQADMRGVEDPLVGVVEAAEQQWHPDGRIRDVRERDHEAPSGSEVALEQSQDALRITKVLENVCRQDHVE